VGRDALAHGDESTGVAAIDRKTSLDHGSMAANPMHMPAVYTRAASV
jgi:methionyl-tRNA formyltransferase